MEKKLIHKITPKQLLDSMKGKPIELVKAPPKGYAIKICEDGIHYEIVKIK